MTGISTLVGFLEDIQIENLSIPFTAVATDIITEKEVWINTGSLFDAIRASVSLPLFFTPVKNGESLLIDGGVLNPVPIAPTFNDDTDLTIAVNLGGSIIKNDNDSKNDNDDNKDVTEFQIKIKKFIETLDIDNKNTKNWSMYEVADKAFDTMQSTIARMKIASYPPDLEIEIARNTYETLEFDKSAEIIKLGYEKAQLAYDLYNQGEK